MLENAVELKASDSGPLSLLRLKQQIHFMCEIRLKILKNLKLFKNENIMMFYVYCLNYLE